MVIGVTRERKNQEKRVGLTPDNAKEYIRHGHRVLIETSAGIGAGFADEEYRLAGCQIKQSEEEVFDEAEMIIKVKEPEECEYPLFREGQILFTYLHLAPAPELTEFLVKRKVEAVAYETLEDNGRLPCLAPMSQIAGRLSFFEGAKYLQERFGGEGVLLGKVDNVPSPSVLVIGGGTAGEYAARSALGADAHVTLLDISEKKLAYLKETLHGDLELKFSNETNLIEALKEADLVIGAALVPGGATPKVIRREHLKYMKKGAVIVDIAIDQGGCCQSSHVTTHDDPIYIEEGIVHYCVGNMPGAVARTSTIALTATTLPYGLLIADLGLEEACKRYSSIRTALNIHDGQVVNENVKKALGL